MKTIDPTILECAYMAGLLDGEGTITIATRTRSGRELFVPKVTITNTNPIVMELFKKHFGGCVRCRHFPKRKPCYDWECQYKSAGIILRALLPFLRLKRAQAELVLQLCECIQSATTVSHAHIGSKPFTGRDEKVIQFRKELTSKIRTLNQTGGSKWVGEAAAAVV